MPPLILYAFPISQPARAVTWLLEIKGLAYEYKTTQPHTDTEKPEFWKVAPTGRIPAINDDGFILFESNAIMQYLCNKHKWTDYYPENYQSRALVDQYMHWHHTNLRLVTLEVWAPIFFATIRKQTIPKVTDPLPSSVQFSLRLFDDFFLGGKKKYIAGESSPTIADIAAYCELDQIALSKMFDLTPYTNITAWMDNMRRLPKHDEVRVPLSKSMARLMSATGAKL